MERPDLVSAIIAIRDAAEAIARTVRFEAQLSFDSGERDGAPRKLLDNTRIAAMGWTPETGLDDGLAPTYDWFLEHVAGGAG